MVADLQQSMKRIKDASSDFLSLMQQLKAFFGEDTEITVVADGTAYTVPSIARIVRMYQGGFLGKVYLEGEDSLGDVTIAAVDGKLTVAFPDGTLAPIAAASLEAASVGNSSIEKAVVRECTVDRLTLGGDAALREINTGALYATGLTGGDAKLTGAVTASSAKVGTLGVSQFSAQRVTVAPDGILDVFADPVPYGYNNAFYVFDWTTQGLLGRWVCKGLTAPAKRPESYGFMAPDTIADPMVPDMVRFQGTTAWTDLKGGIQPSSVRIAVPYRGGYQHSSIQLQHDSTDPTIPTTQGIPFCRFLGWPIRSYSDEGTNGTMYLHEVREADEGRILYVCTSGNPWPVPRDLRVDRSTSRAELRLAYMVPPYSCKKFRLSRRVEGDVTHSLLELV